MNQIKLYPINLNLSGKKCLVIGGGKVAQRKVASLLNCQARVFVISPALNNGLSRLAKSKRIFHIKKNYASRFLKGAFLVVAATNDLKVNSQAASDAGKLNILVNVVDYPRLSNFWVPAVLRRGPLAISISTSGKSPYLARELKALLKRYIGAEYAQFLNLLGGIRQTMSEKHKSLLKRKSIYKRAINSSILKLLKRKKTKEARELFLKVIGKANG